MKKTLLTMSIIAAATLVGCDDEKTKYVDVVEYVDKGLAEITDEQAGENCEFGGKKVIKGIDADDSGFLDGPELDDITTTYVCSEYEIVTEVVINNIDATQEQIDDAVQNAVAPYLTLQGDLDTADANLLTAQDAVDALEIQLAQVQEDLDAKTDEVTWLEGTLITAAEYISTVQDDLDAANNTISALETEKTDLEEQLATAQATIDQNQADVEAIKTEMVLLLVDNGMTSVEASAIVNDLIDFTSEEIAALLVADYLDRYKVIFVTNSIYNGNLGGLSGADAICQADSEVAESTVPAGTYKAWLSSTTVDVRSRLNTAENIYKSPDGTLIVNDWTDLIAGGSLESPINMNEFSEVVSGYAWTNTNHYGTIRSASDILTCVDWTDAAAPAVGLVGKIGELTGLWTSLEHRPCSENARLYCIQQ